ncbi:hypothetical protein AMS68_003391 [Peltaster fructicola]|uniref:CUE domain-containing protein n=1 Tax=Peltaster fructicola TaxID=286661 RepID=A0A6H0XT16_9PEZI|nr:hypothetical protein AMS68_003391 [Peltaster fructicola]
MTSSNENPWEDQVTPTRQAHQQQHTGDLLGGQAAQNPWQLSGEQSHSQDHPSYTAQPDPWATQQHSTGFAPPPGPPPSQTRSQAPKLPDETSRFVPESERGEQREALEQFEISHHGQQSPDDRNIEALTRQFPKIDSALVAAIYNDSKDMGASREMLGELSDST